MVMPAIRRHWTTADVRALTDERRPWPRYELIAGELLVTPAPGPKHQIAVIEILMLLGKHLEDHPIGQVLPSPADLELRPGTITQPDVFVIPADTTLRGEFLQWPDVTSLLLAVEILSPGSLRTDRVVKRDFYIEAGVREYWIVDLDARVVERWTPSQETPEIRRERINWAPEQGRPLQVDLTAVFERIDRKSRMRSR
jgi:Uma2 family endonuclease